MPTADPAADPLWYKDAVLYEVHVRAFADGNGDGIGDFVGLTDKIDYIADLGVTAVWLLPFYPSPLKDDGYDIADYTTVHPAYGTLDDFKTFLDVARRVNEYLSDPAVPFYVWLRFLAVQRLQMSERLTEMRQAEETQSYHDERGRKRNEKCEPAGLFGPKQIE